MPLLWVFFFWMKLSMPKHHYHCTRSFYLRNNNKQKVCIAANEQEKLKKASKTRKSFLCTEKKEKNVQSTERECGKKLRALMLGYYVYVSRDHTHKSRHTIQTAIPVDATVHRNRKKEMKSKGKTTNEKIALHTDVIRRSRPCQQYHHFLSLNFLFCVLLSLLFFSSLTLIVPTFMWWMVAQYCIHRFCVLFTSFLFTTDKKITRNTSTENGHWTKFFFRSLCIARSCKFGESKHSLLIGIHQTVVKHLITQNEKQKMISLIWIKHFVHRIYCHLTNKQFSFFTCRLNYQEKR